MKTDFNNLRKKACFAYDNLTKKLNETIERGPYGDDNITIPVDYIQKEMDELRYYIMSIAIVEQRGNDGFKDVSDDVVPIRYFNDEDI